ncbi:MAG: C40 family peptidase [Bacteroidales bacterium]|nr:C40 family peptidase [Bacteroidales bacterium]
MRGLYKRLTLLGFVALLCTAPACRSSRSTAQLPSTKKTSSKGSTSNSSSKDNKSKEASQDTYSTAHNANCKKLGLTPSSGDNTKLYAECASWMGVPYKYGGTSKSGTDCSGFTYSVYKAVYGKTLTRQSAGMLSDNCTRIKKEQLREGDLVFFRTDGKRTSTPNHVGIYLKNNKFIHASTSKGVVVSDLNQDYYVKNWIAAGRVK